MASASPRTFDFDQRLPGIGLRLPARMTALPLASGRVALISPIPLDETLAAQLEVLGEVAYLIAPNLLHHLYIQEASVRYPRAQVVAPRALRRKRPELRIDLELEEALPEELADSVTALPFEGSPALCEYVFYHGASRTLVVTDLVFNVLRPKGWVAHVLLFAVGCHGRLAQSRAVRVLIKDRTAASRSAQRMLALPFESLVVAHGEVVRDDPRGKLTEALRWLLRGPRRLLVADSS